MLCDKSPSQCGMVHGAPLVVGWTNSSAADVANLRGLHEKTLALINVNSHCTLLILYLLGEGR
jgi:hypothetical protein